MYPFLLSLRYVTTEFIASVRKLQCVELASILHSAVNMDCEANFYQDLLGNFA